MRSIVVMIVILASAFSTRDSSRRTSKESRQALA